MAFDDLDQAERAEADAAAGDAASAVGTGEPDSESAPESGSTVAAADESDRADNPGQTGDPDPATPAFGFDEAKQRPLYARQEAWDAFEDALAIDVEATLRGNDVRDAPKRELHDAALRVLADHADEVAARVLAARGLDD